MRHATHRLTLGLLAALAVALLASGDELPLSPQLLENIPGRYRAKAKAVRLSAEAQKYYATAPEGQRFEAVTDAISARPEGLAFLVASGDLEKDGPRRAILFRSLARSKGLSGNPEKHRGALALLFRHARADSDASAALAALDALRRIRNDELARLLRQRLDLARLLRQRLDLARRSGTQADLERLSEEESRHYKWFGEVAIPEAQRDAPPVFPVVGEERPVRVLAFGDFGSGQEPQVRTAAAMRAYAKEHPFDFGITLGDNFYPTSMDSPSDPRWKTQWEDLYGPLGIPFYASLGNHDYGRPVSPAAELWYSEKSASWRVPARYYTFTAGAVQFFQIDTVDLSERELRWLDEQLAQSQAAWKVVYGHYQIYSATRGDNDQKQDDLVHRLLPILKKRRVDLYLCGHDHNLQILKAEEGVNFVVAGGGGATLYDFTQKDYSRNTFREKTNGFAVLEADPESFAVRLVNAESRELSALEL